MEILKMVLIFVGFIWLTFVITFILCFYKHMNKPKADFLIDEMDLFIKEFGGNKDERK